MRASDRAFRALDPASLLGVEQEYTLRLDGQPVDFRWIIDRLPLDGSRVDPADPLAVRCAWGGVITADGAEAEVAIPPVVVEPGFTEAARGLARAGREELRRALPPEVDVAGYSTHLSVAMPDRINERVCALLSRRFAPALMLLTGRPDTPGLLLRPRPSRTELGIEHVDGALLGAAGAFAIGAARVAAAAVAGDRAARRALPPALRTRAVPAVRRYGLYLDRTAFGGDLLRDGRAARLRTRMGRGISGQEVLEAAWEAALRGLGDVGASGDLKILDSLVAGGLPLGGEGLPPPVEPPSAPIAAGPFGEALRPYRGATLQAQPMFITWDFVVFEAWCRGRVVYACTPRDQLEAFLGALHRGRLDQLFEEFVAGDREQRTLAEHGQTREPGLYDAVAEPTRLLPPERAPGGRGGPSIPGGRHSKEQRGREPRPRARRGGRRGLLVAGGILALAAIAAVAAIALTGRHGSTPAAQPSGPHSGPGGPTATSPTPSVSPTPTKLPAPTALSGSYKVTVTVAHLGTTIQGVKVGQSSHSNWLLSTDCAKRPCSLRLIGQSRTGEKIDATGPFIGRTVRGHASSPLSCVRSDTGQTLFQFRETGGAFVVHVTDIERVTGVPQATAFRGSFHFTWEPPAGQATPGCQKTDETDTVAGTISKVPVPEPLPSGAATPPVSQGAVAGTWEATLHVKKAEGIPGKKTGQKVKRLYVFIPKCPEGVGCALRLVREGATGISENQLKPGPEGTYTEIIKQTYPCGNGKGHYLQKVQVRVEDAENVAGIWRATRLSGAFVVSNAASPGTKGCTEYREVDGITADAQI